MIDNPSQILHLISSEWSQKTVLVVGDVMLDKYVWGDVRRISPEAPVPVVLAKRQSVQPGGAANVALNIARLGAHAQVIGFTGNDDDAASLGRAMRENGIEAHFVATAGFPTISKLRILGSRQQMLRLDSERLGDRSQECYDKLSAEALKLLETADVVVLSDYAKGVLSTEVCLKITRAARAKGIPVLVDPKSSDFSKYQGATTICPNLDELSKASKGESRELEALLKEAESMVSDFGLDFLTVTLSEKGIALVRPDGRYSAPAQARQVFDVSGAGDTVISVLALCLASKIAPETGIEVANLAAGVVVGKVGTVPIERHELLTALGASVSLHAVDKTVTLEELLPRVAAWRQNGEKIVFTNGCFDLLHVGHIALLEQARLAGDRLIVAINSDDSVRALKGTSRPVVGQNERARVLAALTAVDAVVVFDEATPINLILATRPDVIVKGGDYVSETVVGASEAAAWGGQVRIVPTVQGYSITGLIAKSNADK